MSSINKHSINNINKRHFSDFRSIIETVMYGNNIKKIHELSDAYSLAQSAPGTIITDLPVYNSQDFLLDDQSKILVFNDGEIVGRTAIARRIIGEPGVDAKYYSGILREAVYSGRFKTFYHGEVIVGLDKEFTIKSHILLSEGFENNLYSYLLNFKFYDSIVHMEYSESKKYEESDLIIYSDPDWIHPDFPHGLIIIDPEHNVSAVLGLRYFGELKKATLSLAWAAANRNGFIACHGGLKQYKTQKRDYTMAVFGLSGSGKSTITLSNTDDEMETSILHDDAFIINEKSGTTTALEPSYFDKTQDYNTVSDEVKYFLTCQNVGVTLNDSNEKVLVLEDIRNGNGRTIKSHFVTPNRVNHINSKINSIFWIMKDDAFPPIVKISNPRLATVFGLTISTKRTSAENVINASKDNVIVPFADPFRCYPLEQDYLKFLNLFKESTVDCYIINTGTFNEKKISPSQTLGAINSIVKNNSEFIPFANISDVYYLNTPEHRPDFKDNSYLNKIKKSMEFRLDFLKKINKNEYTKIPQDAIDIVKDIIKSINDLSQSKQ